MIGRLDRSVAKVLRGLRQTVDARGRVRIHIPSGHQLRKLAYRAGWAYRARVVASLAFGRLGKKQTHHLNRRRDDDRIRNLVPLTRRQHGRAHSRRSC